ncbi:MAG: hypothetical protein QOE23_3740 [Pseudonocardiales bacterium]|nr:hypothetical protein [Pseudonocardiales bacterium]
MPYSDEHLFSPSLALEYEGVEPASVPSQRDGLEPSLSSAIRSLTDAGFEPSNRGSIESQRGDGGDLLFIELRGYCRVETLDMIRAAMEKSSDSSGLEYRFCSTASPLDEPVRMTILSGWKPIRRHD